MERLLESMDDVSLTPIMELLPLRGVAADDDARFGDVIPFPRRGLTILLPLLAADVDDDARAGDGPLLGVEPGGLIPFSISSSSINVSHIDCNSVHSLSYSYIRSLFIHHHHIHGHATTVTMKRMNRGQSWAYLCFECFANVN